jgi:hypothetical protein
MKKKIPLPISIAILVAIALLACGVIFYKARSWLADDIANQQGMAIASSSDWIAYHNSTEGFGILLPPTWPADETGAASGPIFLQSSLDAPLHGIGLPPSGNMWVEIAKGICNDPSENFVLETMPSILEKTVCVNGFQITLGLWDNDLQKVSHEATLEKILESFSPSQ